MIVLKTLHQKLRQRVHRGCIDLLAKKLKKQNLMVPVEKHTCFCMDGSLEKFTAKSGRGFLKCKKETCTIVCSRRGSTCMDLIDAYENVVYNKVEQIKSRIVD